MPSHTHPLLLGFAALMAPLLGTPSPTSAEEIPSLQAELDARAAGFAATAPAEMQAAFAQGIDDVRRTGLVETAKNVGDQAPSAVLNSTTGSPVDLSDLWADGHVVVSFYRGGWCPYCNIQLKALQRSLAKIEGAGATLVAVTPEIAEKAVETSAKNELGFTVLSDKDNRLAKAFGIVFELPEVIRPIYENRIGLAAYNGNDDNELPLSATYVIDSRGVIRWAFLDADYKRRAEPGDIVAAVKALND
ncbi:MAG: peroxiredoxin-like family protein [Planctomycetota bacterium]